MNEDEKEFGALSDEELADISAGKLLGPKYWIQDSKGRDVGRKWKLVIAYWPCPNCGRPTHRDWALRNWCDSCDASWIYYNCPMKPWAGGEEALIAAADEN